jgi:hypothetical protein
MFELGLFVGPMWETDSESKTWCKSCLIPENFPVHRFHKTPTSSAGFS